MAWVAVAIAGSAIVGGVTSYLSADAQAGAANNATDNTRAQFEETRADYAPWRDAGKLALNQQTNLLGLNGSDAATNAFTQFREDPGYKYSVDQAVQGVDRSAAARGLLTSGATIKAIQDRAGHLADQGYGNYFQRLQGLAGTGLTATGGTATAGANAAANEGNSMIAAGNARASGYNGVASSLNSGLNNYFAYNGAGGGGGGYAPLVGQSSGAEFGWT